MLGLPFTVLCKYTKYRSSLKQNEALDVIYCSSFSHPFIIHLSFGLCKKQSKQEKKPEACLQISGDKKLLLAAAVRKELKRQQKHSCVKT